jgi:hypothetical protein
VELSLADLEEILPVGHAPIDNHCRTLGQADAILQEIEHLLGLGKELSAEEAFSQLKNVEALPRPTNSRGY